MINYKKAKETAINIDNNINTVYTDNNSYIFSNSNIDMYNPVVVTKSNGDVMNYLDYISNNEEAGEVRQLKFDSGEDI